MRDQSNSGCCSGVVLFLLLFSPLFLVTPSGVPSSSSSSNKRNSKQLYYSQLLFPSLHGLPHIGAGASVLSSNKYLSQPQQSPLLVSSSSASSPYYTTLWMNHNNGAQHPFIGKTDQNSVIQRQQQYQHQQPMVSHQNIFGSPFYQVPWLQQFHQQQQQQQFVHQQPQHQQQQQHYPNLVPANHHFSVLGKEKNGPRLEFREGDEDTEVIDIITDSSKQDDKDDGGGGGVGNDLLRDPQHHPHPTTHAPVHKHHDCHHYPDCLNHPECHHHEGCRAPAHCRRYPDCLNHHECKLSNECRHRPHCHYPDCLNHAECQHLPECHHDHHHHHPKQDDKLDSEQDTVVIENNHPSFQRGQVEQANHEKHDNNIGFNRAHVEQQHGHHGPVNVNSLATNNIPAAHDYERVSNNYWDSLNNNGVDNSLYDDQSSSSVGPAGGHKVICYFANWAYYRTEGSGQYLPENVDPQLCTHIIYAFAKYDSSNGHLQPTDSEVDDGQQFFVRIVDLKKKNPNLKVLLAVGGWTDSGDNKYSELANSPYKRRAFAQEAMNFVKYYAMDGISIDWHYPVCWQSDCSKGPKSDKNAFSELLRELKSVFDPQGLLIAASLSGYKEVIDLAYDVPKLSEYLSFMNIMTYDYHGSWESRTGHLSPLYQGPPAEDLKPTYNSNYTMEYYVSKGAERSKLILGIPFYGQTFSLENQYDSNLGSLAEGPGNPGESTQQPGMLAYYEICKRVKQQGWATRRDISGSWGPHAYKDNQWVGYDDPEFVRRKSRYIKKSNFGGAFVFTLDLDDYDNICCGGDQPLLRTIANELLGVPQKKAGCSPQAPGKPVVTHPTYPSSTTPQPPPSPGCYYESRPHPTDCNRYYKCIGDREIIQQCPAGLHWNRHTLGCDWPQNAGCDNDNVTPRPIHGGGRPTPQTPPPPPPPSETVIVVAPPEQQVPEHQQEQGPPPSAMDECVTGEYYPGQSCDEYYLCSDGRKKVQMCGSGLHWNAEKKLCDWPSQAKCQKKKTESEMKFDSEPCQVGEHTGSPTDCGVYYVCVHGERQKFRCQGDLHWNDHQKVCDWPSNAGCTASSEPVFTTSTTYRPASYPQQTSTIPPFPSETQSTTTTTMAPTTYSTTEHYYPDSTMYPTYPSTQVTSTYRPPSSTASLPPLPAGMTQLSGDYMIVCYFTNWAWYRPGMGKFKPEHINEDLCSHIVYGFAVLDTENLTIKPHDSWADIDNRFYEQVAELRNRGKKVTLAIGGWNDSLGDKYSRLVNNPAARRRFVQHVIEFIERYNFQGLDLDWEYPKCWQVDCDKGPASDKQNFAALVRELSEAFRPRGLLLSSAVSPSKKVIDEGYDVPALSRYFDWISVMTYDFHGQWDKKTGHVAPLYFHEEDDIFYFNANYSINYWIQNGADRRKIVMGMPLYGQSFTLTKEQENGLNAPSTGGGIAGEYTRSAGFLAYYEICTNIQQKGWNVVYDQSGTIGPYAYKGNQWVSFDDVAMIRKKSEFIRSMDLGGGMVWALDLDDFKNTCGQGESPLLTTIRKVLGPARSGSSYKLPSSQKNEIPKYPTKKPMPMPVPVDTSRPSVPVVGESQPVGSGKLKTKPGDVCDEAFRPHDQECSKYYQCLFGKYVEQQCPPGTVWNNDRCDWPGNSNCKPGGPPPPPTSPKPIIVTTVATTTYRPQSPQQPSTAPTTTTTTRRPQHPQQQQTDLPIIIPTTTSRPSYPMETSTSYYPVSRPTKPTPTTKSPEWCKLNWCPTPKPLPPNKHPEVNVPPSEYKVVCYFTNWAWYRPGMGKYKPEDINFNLCTHIAYGFAVLNPTTLLIRPHDGWADIDNQFYKQVTELRSRGIKVVLALGGWNDSLGDKYSRLVHDPAARRRFVEHAIEFLIEYDFDGLDLDWEYPKCWQVDCEKGPATDKEGFVALIRELHAAFQPLGLTLSSAVSPNNKVIDLGYDVPAVSRYLDWIAVMTYDFFGQWDGKTGHNAPLYGHPEIENTYFNTNFSINYWIEKGADRKKIIMGMPMYGQSFTLVNSTDTGLNSKSSGGSQAGEFTRQKGFLAYYEICNYIQKRDWTVVQDDQHRIGPYAYKGNQWVSFDDIDQIRRKSEYIKRMGLGGGMIWALDLDDFRGSCGCEEHPLLKTINRVLRRYPEPDPGCRF